MRWFSVYFPVVWCALTIAICFGYRAKSGPYHTTLIGLKKCEKPKPPYVTNSKLYWHTEIYNTSTKTNLCRGNITILNKVTDFSVKFKAYYWQNNAWSLSRVYNARCEGLMMNLLLKVVNINGDSRKCSVNKGSFLFNDIEWNVLDHMLARVREYGRMLWVFQYLWKDGTFACWEAECQIDPA